MYTRSDIHYYSDGDFEMVAENIVFRVHKTILFYASAFFETMFSNVRPTESDMSTDPFPVPRLYLPNEKAANLEKLLTFLYPNTYFEISWDDVSDFLYLADKYLIEKLRKACEAFLCRGFYDEPLQALKLAEQYRIASVYKESSKLVLNNFEHFFHNAAETSIISPLTIIKLKVSRQEYIEGLNRLYSRTVDREFPPLSSEHLRSKFEECVKDICTFPIPNPSDVWSQLHGVDCSRHFECREELRRLKGFIHEKIVEFFGEYETLAARKSMNVDDIAYYPFIELGE